MNLKGISLQLATHTDSLASSLLLCFLLCSFWIPPMNLFPVGNFTICLTFYLFHDLCSGRLGTKILLSFNLLFFFLNSVIHAFRLLGDCSSPEMLQLTLALLVETSVSSCLPITLWPLHRFLAHPLPVLPLYSTRTTFPYIHPGTLPNSNHHSFSCGCRGG